MVTFLLGDLKHRMSMPVKAAKGASSKVALTGWESVLSRLLHCYGVDSVQFLLKKLVRCTIIEDLSWKAVTPDFDLADLLV